MWKGPDAFAPTLEGALDFEQYLNAFDDTQLVSWFQHQLASYVLPELELHLKPGTGPYAKPAHSHSIQTQGGHQLSSGENGSWRLL